MLDLTYIIPDMKTNTDNRTEERKNRFNGESVMLTKEEASRHDKLFLCEIMATLEDKQAGFDGASNQSSNTMYSSAKYLLNQSRPLRTSCHK